MNLPEPVDWNGFKVLFYKKYFPRTIRNQMLSQLWALKQGNRSVAEYEAEFNRLMKVALEGIRDQELTKIQKFRDGLNLELQLDTQGYDGMTLGDLINKAKETEQVRNKMKQQDDAQKGGVGKRSIAIFEGKKFDVGPSKRPMFEKIQAQAQGQGLS